MALIKDRAAPVFDSEQVHKGDLIRAKHKTWDEYKNGLVVGITSNELVVLYHTGIGNVSNHFVMLASEVAGGLSRRKNWQRAWQSMRVFRRCFYRKHRTTKPRGGE